MEKSKEVELYNNFMEEFLRLSLNVDELELLPDELINNTNVHIEMDGYRSK